MSGMASSANFAWSAMHRDYSSPPRALTDRRQHDRDQRNEYRVDDRDHRGIASACPRRARAYFERNADERQPAQQRADPQSHEEQQPQVALGTDPEDVP